MTFHLPPISRLLLPLMAGTLALGGCATMPMMHKEASTPDPITPTEQYALTAQSQTKRINLRVEPTGLSENQRHALDQVAAHASWINGEPVDIEIVTNGDPAALAAGQGV